MGYASACAVLAIAAARIADGAARPSLFRPIPPRSRRDDREKHVLAVPACGMFAARHSAAASAMDPELQRRTRRAIAMGLHYLRGQQAEDGSTLNSVGITSLALRAFLESPGEVQRERWRVRHTPGRLHREQGPARWIDQLDVAGDGLQHRRRLERAVSDQEPEVRPGDRGRPEVPPPASGRRGGGLQAGPSATTAASATAAASGPTCRTSTSCSRDSRGLDGPEGSGLAEGPDVRQPDRRTAAKATTRSGPPTTAGSRTGRDRTLPNTRTGHRRTGA